MTIDRLLELQTSCRDMAAKIGRTSTAISFVDFLLERPAVTVTQAKDHLGVTYPAAKSTSDKLVDMKILAPFANKYRKVFYAPSTMRASRMPDPPLDGEKVKSANDEVVPI